MVIIDLHYDLKNFFINFNIYFNSSLISLNGTVRIVKKNRLKFF